MGILSGAIARPVEKTNLQSQKGIYNGIFTGMSTPYEWHSPWRDDPCKGCNGTKRSTFNTDMMCSKCGGTGIRIEQHVKLFYQLETGVTEEEDMLFKISPPSQGKNKAGQMVTFSPSTLYLRLRELSGIPNATPEQLDVWYDSLPQPISIPITLLIGDNQNQTATKITALSLRSGPGQRPPQYAQAPTQYAQTPSPQPMHQYPPPPPMHAPRAPGGPNGAGPIPASQFAQTQQPVYQPATRAYAESALPNNEEELPEIPF